MPRISKVAAQIHRQVRSALEKSNLSDSHLVVAVSGGQDSLTLLYALHSMQESLSLKLHGAHLNHQLRGNASDADADFVSQTFNHLGIPHTIERTNVAAIQKENGLSLEEAARNARYEFLARVVTKHETDAVALGHTSDDQAETVLMHLIRGSGLSGLTGMDVVSSRIVSGTNLNLFRPLLGVSRQQTAEYCHALNLMPREDETNLSLDITRNRIRLELLPALEGYNPAAKDALLRLSRSASQDVEYIVSQVATVWDEVVGIERDALILDRVKFQNLHQSVQNHLLRRAVAYIKGDLREVEQNHIDDMAQLIVGRIGTSLNLPGGFRFAVGYEKATLASQRFGDYPPPALEGKQRLNIPGETHLNGWGVRASISEGEGNPIENSDDPYVESFDYDAVGKELWVRSRKDGDRFQPLGMPQAKKLQDFMVDSKIPRDWRDHVPLVISPRGIAWVVGYRIADWGKVTSKTKRRLEVRFRLTDGLG